MLKQGTFVPCFIGQTLKKGAFFPLEKIKIHVTIVHDDLTETKCLKKTSSLNERGDSRNNYKELTNK